MKRRKEITEGLFSSWCKSKGYFRLKLQVDRSNTNIFDEVIAKSMPSDFCVVTPTNVYFVEVKEILKGDLFPNSRLRQQYKLAKISEFYTTGIMDGYVLLNFVEKKVVVLINIFAYNLLLKSLDKKSMNLSDIPDVYKYSWKTLTF